MCTRHDAHALGAFLDHRRLARPRRARRRRRADRRRRGTRSPPPASKRRARSSTRSTLASACSPAGQIATPACARVASRSRASVSAMGRRLRLDGGARRGSRSAPRHTRRRRRPARARRRRVRSGCEPACRRRGGRRGARRRESAKKRAAQRGVDGRARRRATRSRRSALRTACTSSRSWNERPPTSTCGIRRASSARTYGAREVVAEALEALEQQADVARADRRRGSARSRSVTVQPLWWMQPVDEGADRVGQRLLDRESRDLAAVAVRARHGQRDHRGLAGGSGRGGARAGRSGLRPAGADIIGANAAFTAAWIAGALRKLVVR